MRIGFDAKRAFFNFRGLGNYTRTLIDGLAQYHPELEFFLYTPVPRDNRGLVWAEGLANHCHHPPVIRTPKTFPKENFPSLWRSVFLTRDLRKDDLDIYHGTSHELPALTPKSGQRRYKTVVTIHDLIFLRFPEFFPWIDRKVYLWKFKKSCAAADVVLAICQQTKDDLIEFLGVPDSKIRIAYQSYHPRFAQEVAADDKNGVLAAYGLQRPYILNVGAIDEHKNVLGLLRAYAMASKTIPHQLVIVGKGHGRYHKQVLEYVQRHNLGQHVRFLENVPSEHLPALYQGAKLFVFPSFFEGFGLPIVEALASGTPVLTSQGSCFPESGGPQSSYVNPYAPEELAMEMENLLSSPEKLDFMAQEGRKYVQRFSLERTTENVFSLYRSLLGQ